MNEDSLLKISKSDMESSLDLYKCSKYPQALFFFQQSVEKVTKYIGLQFHCIEESDLQRKIRHDPVKVFRILFDKFISDPNKIINIGPYSLTNIKQIVKNSCEAECINVAKNQIEEILNEPKRIDENKKPFDAVCDYLSNFINIKDLGLDNIKIESIPESRIENEIKKITYGTQILKFLLIISLVISKYRIDDFRYPSEKIDDPSDYFNSVNPLVKNLPYFISIMKEIVLKFSGEIEWGVDNKHSFTS
jgi:hypothetical protein